MFNRIITDRLSVCDDCLKIPLARQKFSSCFNYPFLYVFGGRRNNVCLKDFWQFDIERKCWSEITIDDLPLFEHHASCFFDGKLFVYGGQFCAFGSTFLSWKPPDGKHFKPVYCYGSSPPNYRGHTLVVYGCSMFMFGGWCDQFGSSNKIWKYDTKTKTWTYLKTYGERPSPRYGHSCVIFGDSMWIFGGENHLFKRCSDIWRYNFVTNQWNQIKTRTALLPLSGHSVSVFNDSMLIFGGFTENDSENTEIFSFSFVTLSWTSLGKSEKILRDKLCVRQTLPIETNIDLQHHNESVAYANCFERSVNGNLAQRSADSGYSECTVHSASSADSLVSATTNTTILKNLKLPKHSVTNLAFVTDDFNMPGYVDENLHTAHKKFASMLAIPRHEFRSKNNNDDGEKAQQMELKEFVSSVKKSQIENDVFNESDAKTLSNLLLITASKILIITEFSDSSVDSNGNCSANSNVLTLCTLQFE